MEQLHKEYIDYYKTRLRKYENNPIYTESCASEKALYDAIAECAELEEFRHKVENGNLSFKNAVALVKDQEKERERFYLSINEPLKAEVSSMILAALDGINDVNALTETVNGIRKNTLNSLSLDSMIDNFLNEFTMLENIECWSEADVPDEWKQDMKRWVNDTVSLNHKIWHENFIAAIKKLDPERDFDYTLLWEERHRRLLPFPDEVLEKRIARHKKIMQEGV